jgi:predicted P-loop ATPase/GTPase
LGKLRTFAAVFFDIIQFETMKAKVDTEIFSDRHRIVDELWAHNRRINQKKIVTCKELVASSTNDSFMIDDKLKNE